MKSISRTGAMGVTALILGITGFARTTVAQGLAVAPCAVFDDGVSENSVGLTNGGGVVWMHRQGAPGQVTQVSAIRTAYGTTAFPGSPVSGIPTTVAIWDDPNDDGNPNDLVLVATAASTTQNGGTNILNVTTFPSPVTVNGVYFIGVSITHPPGVFPAPLDQTTPSAGRAWIVGNGGAAVDLNNLNAAGLPPTDTDAIGLPGVWLLRADCMAVTITSYCPSTQAACPCGNVGAAGNGCANSTGANGALLSASGTAMIGGDTLTLTASGMPSSSSCLFAQGTSTASGTFGDGLQCLGGSIVRLRTRIATNGSVSFGASVGGDPLVSVIGGVSAGTYNYQAFYRDAASFCTSSTFNSTNGLSVVWN